MQQAWAPELNIYLTTTNICAPTAWPCACCLAGEPGNPGQGRPICYKQRPAPDGAPSREPPSAHVAFPVSY